MSTLEDSYDSQTALVLGFRPLSWVLANTLMDFRTVVGLIIGTSATVVFFQCRTGCICRSESRFGGDLDTVKSHHLRRDPS